DPSGKYLLASGKTASLFDAETGEVLSTMRTPRECQRVALTSDLRVATASTGGEIQFWDLKPKTPSPTDNIDETPLQVHPNPSTMSARCADTIRVLSSVSDGRFVLVGAGDGTVRLYDTRESVRDITPYLT